MHIDMQFPRHGTEHLPGSFRRRQAKSVPSWRVMDQLVALRRLTPTGSAFFPQLLAEDVRAQTSNDDYVPAGWAVYMVLTEIPGEALGIGLLEEEEGRWVSTGPFWDLHPGQRRMIREQLEAAYNAAYDVNVALQMSLSSLYWDSNSHRLYVNGKLYPCGNGYGSDVFPRVITTLRFFWLAKVPVGWDRPDNAEDLTMEDLMSAGWKF